jgi:hypothetical protein
VKHSGGEVPVRDQLKPRCCIRLQIILRRNEGRQETQLTLVGEKEDPLGSLEESPSPEAAFLPDVGQHRGVVDPPQNERLAC